jgi:hypothetical protein
MCLLTQGMGLMIRVAASTVKSHAWWGCVFAVLDRCKYAPCHPLPSHTRCSSSPAVRNPPAPGPLSVPCAHVAPMRVLPTACPCVVHCMTCVRACGYLCVRACVLHVQVLSPGLPQRVGQSGVPGDVPVPAAPQLRPVPAVPAAADPRQHATPGGAGHGQRHLRDRTATAPQPFPKWTAHVRRGCVVHTAPLCPHGGRGRHG